MATYCTTVIEVTSSSRVSAGPPASPERRDFIRDIVAADVREGRIPEVVTRFPPEPNGYLHLGHAKAIALDFGIAQEFGGRCHLRFDDTNPIGEEQEYIDSIQEDIRWLGFDWGEHLYFASDYFSQLYDWAVHLIRGGKAYVDDLSADKIREHRGTLTEPGRNSPWRDRPVDENLSLFERMRSCTQPTRGPATSGASIRCTTSPTASRTQSRASPTPSARSSSKPTGRSTTGCSRTCRCLHVRTSTSLPASTSRTPCSRSASCGGL
jgi:hypothetical protein